MWPFKKKDDYFGRLVVKKRSLSRVCTNVVTSKQSEKAKRIEEELVKAAKFFEKHHKQSCCGLAANQLGYKLRVIVVRSGKSWVSYINPSFNSTSIPNNRKVQKVEGCLSHPQKNFNVSRYRKIWAYADNRKPKILTGLEAEAFQHEIDHLDGILI